MQEAEETNMVFYPKIYVDTIKDIQYETLKQNCIHAIILDMDNTLIDFEVNLLERCKRMVRGFKTKWNKIFNSIK